MMDRIDPQLERRINRSLDGELSADEQTALYRELLRDPAAHDVMDRSSAIDATAGEALRRAVGVGVAESGEGDDVSGGMGADEAERSRAVAAVLHRANAGSIAREPMKPAAMSMGRLWPLGLAAAVVLAAPAVWMMMNPPQPRDNTGGGPVAMLGSGDEAASPTTRSETRGDAAGDVSADARPSGDGGDVDERDAATPADGELTAAAAAMVSEPVDRDLAAAEARDADAVDRLASAEPAGGGLSSGDDDLPFTQRTIRAVESDYIGVMDDQQSPVFLIEVQREQITVEEMARVY